MEIWLTKKDAASLKKDKQEKNRLFSFVKEIRGTQNLLNFIKVVCEKGRLVSVVSKDEKFGRCYIITYYAEKVIEIEELC